MQVGPMPGTLAAVELNQARQAQNTQQLQEGLQLLQAQQTQEAREGSGPDHDGDGDDASAVPARSMTPPSMGKHLDITA